MKFSKAPKTAAAAANGYLKAKVQDPWEDRSKMKGAKKDNGWGLVKLLANCKPVLPFSGCRIDSPLKAAAVISYVHEKTSISDLAKWMHSLTFFVNFFYDRLILVKLTKWLIPNKIDYIQLSRSQTLLKFALYFKCTRTQRKKISKKVQFQVVI